MNVFFWIFFTLVYLDFLLQLWANMRLAANCTTEKMRCSDQKRWLSLWWWSWWWSWWWRWWWWWQCWWCWWQGGGWNQKLVLITAWAWGEFIIISFVIQSKIFTTFTVFCHQGYGNLTLCQYQNFPPDIIWWWLVFYYFKEAK